MDTLTVVGLSVSLGMDAFSVAVAAGVILPRITGRHLFRLAWHFGLFQGLMPIVGWLVGRTAATYFARLDHWIAFAFLAFIGGRMVKESFSERDDTLAGDPTRGLTLVVLSVATSIDALAVGLSLAFMSISIVGPSVVIGVTAALMTVVGMLAGKQLGSLLGRRMEAVGGSILIAIGLRVLIQHLGS